MSIFGNAYPKFKSGANTVLLEHSIIDVKIVNDMIEHKSVFNSTVNKIPLGTYVEVLITLYLNKYADALAKYSEVNKYKNKTIGEFYRYSDGNPYYVTGTTTACPFYVSEVTPYYLEQTLYWDALKIKLKSTQYCYLVPTDEPLQSLLKGYGFNYGTNYGRQL